MSELVRVIGDGRKIHRQIKSRQSLDNLLIDSFFIDHLSEERVMELRQKYASNTEIIIADFLAGNDVPIPQKLGGLDFASYFSASFMNMQHRPQKPTRSPATPLKAMASLSYSSLLKHEPTKRLTSQAGTKQDFKAVILVDYLYDKLSSQRRETVKKSQSVGEALDASTSLYITQASIPILSKDNKNISANLQKISSSETIENEDIEKYKRIKDNRPPQIRFDLDPEAQNLMAERQELMGQYQDSVQEKVYKRSRALEEKVPVLEQEAKQISSRDHIVIGDTERLRQLSQEMRLMSQFYQVAEVDSREVSTKIVKTEVEIESTLEEHSLYMKNKPIIDAHISEITQNRTEFETSLNNNKYKRCKNLISRVGIIAKESKPLKINKYLKSDAQAYLSVQNEFYNNASHLIREKKNSINASVGRARKEVSFNPWYNVFKASIYGIKIFFLNRKLSKLNKVAHQLPA